MPPETQLTLAYLYPDAQGMPHPGSTYLLPPYGSPALPAPAGCLRVEVGPAGNMAVYRLALPGPVNSSGLIVSAGQIIYLRMDSDAMPNAQAGDTYPAGHPLTLPQDRPQALTLALRLGGHTGIPAWDAAEPRALREHPARPGYGYPAQGRYAARAVALRWLDPATLGFLSAPPHRRLL